MTDQPIAEREGAIRSAFDAGDMQLVASRTLHAYGPEILQFLAARLKNGSDLDEVFSMFAEDLWNSLPKFGWRCSMRTWGYTLARNAANRYASSPSRRPANNVRLSCPDVITQLAQHCRSTTRIYQQTETKNRFRALRERLDPDDQMLLILRVDRQMSWSDLAIAMTGDSDLTDQDITREAARLRKAFERLKVQLKNLALQEGLLKPGDE